MTQLLRLSVVVIVLALEACSTPSQHFPVSPSPTETQTLKTTALNANLPATTMFAISGVVTDRNYSAWALSGATIAVAGGASARSDSRGRYSIRAPAGKRTISVTAPGYARASRTFNVSGASIQDFANAAIVPTGGTARCKDRTWSFSRNRSGTCSHHKGVAYWVCPGVLC